MHRIFSFVFLAVAGTWPMYAQESILGPDFRRQPGRAGKTDGRGAYEVLAPAKPWDLLGEGYQLTGDSTVDLDGNVYFTDSRRNRILKIDLAGKISTWKEGSNGAHGIAFGADGRLYAGQHDRKRIVAFSRDGTESVIAEGVQSHHLTVTSRNEIYLTEPPAHKVWLVDARGRKRVANEGINWPRGVRVSPGESRLVVNDPPTRWVWSFEIQADGSLTNGRRYYQLETAGGSAEIDAGGMAFDTDGFLYVATQLGVQVCDSSGRVVAIIEAPGSEGVSAVFFGGPDFAWLYVTDGDKMYRRPVKRRGVAPRDAARRF
jgi:sugar lactone lactonase YvrE